MQAGDFLATVANIVGGQRALDYGDKTQNHKRIAHLWNMWMHETRSSGKSSGLVEDNHITAYDVAAMMLLLKIARLMHSPGHTDTHIDIAGYAACMEEISSAMAGDTE